MLTVYVGFDSRMPDAYRVAVRSIRKYNSRVKIKPLVLAHLQAEGIYKRPTTGKSGTLFDEISQAPMATEFALSRFFIPYLSNHRGVSIFCDSDFLLRCDIEKVLEHYDSNYAVQVVKHNHKAEPSIKMDRQIQTSYDRKNWSSFMLINNAHPAHYYRLTHICLNMHAGIKYHQFFWLKDDEIGELPASWNYLVGVSDKLDCPRAVHFTNGTPDMKGYEDCEYADEWRKTLSEVVCA